MDSVVGDSPMIRIMDLPKGYIKSRTKLVESSRGDLARRNLEREASECYKGFVVRNRLKRVSNEAVRCNAFMRKEELRRYTDRYIEFVKSPDGRMLRSNREMREAFWAHFRDHFVRYPDLPV